MELTDRQVEIVEASCSLISQKGLKGLTIKNLSESIGLTEAALYRHFKNKNDIIKTMLSYVILSMNDRLGKILTSDKSEKEKIEQIFESQFNFFQTKPEFAAVIFSEGLFQSHSELRKTVLALMSSKKNILYDAVKKAQEQRVIRDDISGEQIVFMMMGGIRLTILKWILSDYKTNLVASGNTFWTSVEKLYFI